MKKIIFITLMFISLITSCVQAGTYTYDQLADAIYLAEGGGNAKKPYGILSVPCKGEKGCRKICINTIRNNVKRHKSYGYKTHPNYLEFLASRYAPVGVENDPQGLNRNWIKNVWWFLNNPKETI